VWQSVTNISRPRGIWSIWSKINPTDTQKITQVNTLEEEKIQQIFRTRDESQQIAVQDYSRAYNTPFNSSRLQGISVCHYNRCHSSATHTRSSIQHMHCQQKIWSKAASSYSKNSSHSRLNISSIFSQASGLEAFSRYPTHDSFSAMPCRATEFTSHANQRFLSY
jgi:hypothetical protein